MRESKDNDRPNPPTLDKCQSQTRTKYQLLVAGAERSDSTGDKDPERRCKAYEFIVYVFRGAKDTRHQEAERQNDEMGVLPRTVSAIQQRSNLGDVPRPA